MAFQVLDIGPLGVLIQVGVRVGREYANVGLGNAPRTYNALIDTGANFTALSPRVVAEIRPQRVGEASVSRVGVGLISNTFDIAMKFEHHLKPGTWHPLRVVEVALATPGVDVLIGRDPLKQVSLLYDGVNQKLALIY